MKNMKLHIRPKDLTSGSPLICLTLYMIPMFISMFFQQAYNLADSWIAGNRISAAALGAVGTCYPVTVLFIAIASGLSMGTSIYCSQQFGAKNYPCVMTGITTSMFCFLPFSVILCMLGFYMSPVIIRLLAVPTDAVLETRQYLQIYILGLPALFLYNISNGILNGLGDSKTPLCFLVFSSFCNIILDLIFVIILPLGISGLALATLLSQLLASAATAFAVCHIHRNLSGNLSDTQDDSRPPFISPAVLTDILRLGIPSMIQHVFMSTGQLFMQNIINSYGLIVMAGYSVAFRINGLVINSLMALSNALSGFIAQNKGAGCHGRIRQGYHISLIIGYLFSGIVVLLLRCCGSLILSLFIGETSGKMDIISAGISFFQIVSPFYLLVCLKIISDGALRGIGAMTPFMLATVSDVLIRILFGGLFSRLFGLTGVWSIWPLAWLVGTLISFLFYQYYSQKRACEKT